MIEFSLLHGYIMNGIQITHGRFAIQIGPYTFLFQNRILTL